MSELLGSAAGIGLWILLIAVLLWALYFAFGPQVLGLPAMIGVLVAFAGLRVFGNAGLSGLAFVIVGLVVLALVIGMAMRIGNERRRGPGDRG